MRKITLFLALMLTCVSTVMAEVVVGQMYRIKETSQNLYLTVRSYDVSSGGGYGTVPLLEKSEGSKDQVFYFETANEGTYYLKSKSGYYITLRAWNVDATSSTKSEIALVDVETDVYYLKNVGADKYFKAESVGYDSGTWHPFCDCTDESKYAKWTLEIVNESEFANDVEVTYVYKIGDRIVTTSGPVTQEKNSVCAAPAVDFLTIDSYTGTIGETDCEIVVNCSENLPFAVTTDLSAPIWQTVEMHRYGTFRVWEYVGNDAVVKVNDIVNKEDAVADAMLWCFTGNLIDGFRIYNKAAGTGVTLNATANNATVGTAAEGNDVWKLKVGAASADVAACFTNDGANYMNHQGGVIKYWGSNDNGSTCYFYAPGQLVYEAATEFFGIPEGVVGSYLLEEEVEVAINALCALGVDEWIAKSVEEVQIAVQTVKDARASEQVAYADGYYRIYSAQPGLYANNKGLIYNVAGSASNPFRWGTIEETNVDAIVRLTTDNGKVVLQTVNTALYVQGVLGASNPNMTDNGHITLTPLGYAQYNLVFGNGTMHAEGHNEGAGSDGALVSWPGSVNSASAWYLVPATELEVALNVVEGASYATGYYPFPVSANGNTTLNVGVLNADKSKLGLAAVDGVPANTGVVIVNSAAEPTTTLTIGGEFEAAGSNALTGSCTAVTENIANYLVLGVGATTGALGFYETTATEIPANKAFLEAGSLSAVKLDLGGDVTAIESVELGNTNAPIFDLSGRRVLTPAKGGVYIQDGKKFIVK